jgi:hypothetical protein
MTATEDIETQKRGIVGLAYNVGPASRSDRHAVFKNGKLCAALPLRFVAMHYCYDDPRMKTLLNVAMFVFGRHIRMRCRTHCGQYLAAVLFRLARTFFYSTNSSSSLFLLQVLTLSACTSS